MAKQKPSRNIIETEIKVSNHPDDLKYPNSEVNEHSQARMLLFQRLSREQLQLMKVGKLVIDEAKTKEFISSVKINDYVGIFYTFGKVLSKTADSVTLLVEKKNTFTFSLSEIDNAREMGFCQILYRDDKPYGIDLSKKIKVEIIDFSKKTKKSNKKKNNKASEQNDTKPIKENVESLEPKDVSFVSL